MNTHDFRKQFLLALLAYANSRGIKPELVLSTTGIDYKLLVKGAMPLVSEQSLENIWKNLLHLSNDSLFGLHFGESMQLAALGVIGQIVQTSNTAAEALTHAGAMVHLMTDLFTIQVELDKKHCIIHIVPVSSGTTNTTVSFRQIVDYLMVFIVHELDGLMLERIKPIEVSFSYPIADKSEYTRLFRCKVHAKASSYSITIDKAVLDQPVISANYDLQQYLLKQVSGLMPAGLKSGTYYGKIFNYLLTNSYLFSVSLEAVAANFHVSPRSLQRRLKDEGASFAQIVEEVRYKLAVKYLSSGRYGVKDIANTLGYNEPTAFVRAFKRWTGETPHSFKNHLNDSSKKLEY